MRTIEEGKMFST